MITGRGKGKYSDKNLPCCNLSPSNPKAVHNALMLNTMLRIENPVQ
jgi:hypothetical protein